MESSFEEFKALLEEALRERGGKIGSKRGFGFSVSELS